MVEDIADLQQLLPSPQLILPQEEKPEEKKKFNLQKSPSPPPLTNEKTAPATTLLRHSTNVTPPPSNDKSAPITTETAAARIITTVTEHSTNNNNNSNEKTAPPTTFSPVRWNELLRHHSRYNRSAQNIKSRQWSSRHRQTPRRFHRREPYTFQEGPVGTGGPSLPVLLPRGDDTWVDDFQNGDTATTVVASPPSGDNDGNVGSDNEELVGTGVVSGVNNVGSTLLSFHKTRNETIGMALKQLPKNRDNNTRQHKLITPSRQHPSLVATPASRRVVALLPLSSSRQDGILSKRCSDASQYAYWHALTSGSVNSGGSPVPFSKVSSSVCSSTSSSGDYSSSISTLVVSDAQQQQRHGGGSIPFRWWRVMVLVILVLVISTVTMNNDKNGPTTAKERMLRMRKEVLPKVYRSIEQQCQTVTRYVVNKVAWMIIQHYYSRLVLRLQSSINHAVQNSGANATLFIKQRGEHFLGFVKNGYINLWCYAITCDEGNRQNKTEHVAATMQEGGTIKRQQLYTEDEEVQIKEQNVETETNLQNDTTIVDTYQNQTKISKEQDQKGASVTKKQQHKLSKEETNNAQETEHHNLLSKCQQKTNVSKNIHPKMAFVVVPAPSSYNNLPIANSRYIPAVYHRLQMSGTITSINPDSHVLMSQDHQNKQRQDNAPRRERQLLSDNAKITARDNDSVTPRATTLEKQLLDNISSLFQKIKTSSTRQGISLVPYD